jgi:glycosyltransferase involved in cell wall biosynthesis
MKEEIKLINVKNGYDLCIIGVYAAGGVASFIYQLWRYLNKKGINTLLVTDFGELNLEPKSDAINMNQGNFKLIKPLLEVLNRINLKNIYVVQIDTVPFFLPLIKKYTSVLHIEYWPHELQLAISRLKSIYPYFEQELLSNPGQINSFWEKLIKYPMEFDNRWNNKIYLICYWLSLFYADYIGLWIEKHLKIWKSLLANTLVDTKKLFFLPPMIDTEMFNTNEKNYHEIKILINGKKTYKHNFWRTLKIIQTCFPEQEVLITGIDSLSQWYEGINLSQLRCLGFVPYNIVPENYRKANTYVLLSESHEGFSVSTLEAMASGCVPIVSTFVANNMANDVIINGQTGFIVRDEKELRKVLKNLSENPAKLKEISLNARRVVETKYSFQKNLKSYRFFKNLLKRRDLNEL